MTRDRLKSLGVPEHQIELLQKELTTEALLLAAKMLDAARAQMTPSVAEELDLACSTVSREEAARIAGVSVKTVDRALEDREIGYRKQADGRVLIDRDSFRQWARRRRMSTRVHSMSTSIEPERAREKLSA